jgi:hypothetical protein
MGKKAKPPFFLGRQKWRVLPGGGKFRLFQSQLWFEKLCFSNLQKLEIWGWPEHLVGDVGLRSLELLRDLTLRGLWVWDSLPPKLTSFTCTTWYGVRPLPKLVKALEGVETLEDLDICFRTHSRHGIKATDNLEVGYRMDWTGFEPGRIQPRLK